MNAEIISIRKQSNADSIESNLLIIKDGLSVCGIDTRHSCTVGTEPIELKRALKTAVLRSDVIVVCGGIGWESDDNAVATVCSAIGMSVVSDEATVERIADNFAEGLLPENYRNAALVPATAKVFSVAESLLPGCAVSAVNQSIIMLPDDSTTLHAMVNDPVRAFLGRVGGFSVVLEEEKPSPEEFFEPAIVAPDGTEFKPNVAEFYDEEETNATYDDALRGIEPQEPEIVEEVVEQPKEFVDEWDADSLAAQAEEKVDEPEEDDEAEEDTAEEPQKVKKQSIFIKIARFFFPWEGDKGPEIARKMVFLAATIGIIISGCYIFDYFSEKQANDTVLEQVRDMYHPTDTEVNEDGSLRRFDELVAQNSDCIGWINIPNTKIDNPVYQAADNQYYVNRNPNKTYSVYGSIFADFRNTVSVDGNSANITLYGHHMKDGSMFANLYNYKKMSFYQENPVLTFDTRYGTGGKYKIFACMITNVEGKDDNGYYFDYTACDFEDDESFERWVEQIRRRSLYNSPVDVEAGDEILTLSTCTYEIKGTELRCVVVARKVRSGESDAVNISQVTPNAKTIYPAIWYEKKGGAKPSYDDGLLTWIDQPYSDEPSLEVGVDVSSDLTSSDTSGSEGTSSDVASSEVTSSETASGESSQGSDAPASSTAPETSSDAPASSTAPETSSDTPASSTAPETSSDAPTSSTPPETSSDAPASSTAPEASSDATSSTEPAPAE